MTLQVDVRRDELKVSTKDGKILLEGRLFAPVKHKETLWNLVPGEDRPCASSYYDLIEK
jgi:hypothetical protein